jgi:glycosyltransferase involved in cell wall biosynthesis
MHASVPVVASDIPPMAEVAIGADGTAAARLVPLDDLAGWLAAITTLQNDPVEYQRLAAAATSAMRKFSLPRMVDHYEALLDSGDRSPSSA